MFCICLPNQATEIKSVIEIKKEEGPAKLGSPHTVQCIGLVYT